MPHVAETNDTLFAILVARTKEIQKFITCVLHEFDCVVVPIATTMYIMKRLEHVVNGAIPNPKSPF
jgi:hypothetical protein